MYLPTQFPKNQPTRRELLKLLAAGVGGVSLSGWLGLLAAAAQQQGRADRQKSCILLWMDGGPSHVETFDPKPQSGAEIRGELGAIATSVDGIQIGEKFPRLAKLMHHGAIIRSMSTAEADHGRARVYMHTGYRPGAGGITYPGLGSTVSAELPRPDSPLPNFVVTGEPLNKHDVIRDPGYRGPKHQPLVLTDLSRGLENVLSAVPAEEFERRTQLLGQLEQRFARSTQAPVAQAHAAGLNGALQLMRSDRRDCFDLSLEPEASRSRYGDTDFGRGCLLARRLVEAGIGFVEVYLTNWDSHTRPVAEKTRDLMTQVDLGMSSLIRDLHDRGLLESTLIIWMGEFGRTPRINQAGGRDHFAHAWSSALFGGGIRAGQVIGATDATGSEVKGRPVSVMDFMATTCHLLGVDYKKEIDTPAGRPVRIVDKGEQLIKELIV
jgi:uncharacterized protein (DUF1501 family)